MEVDDVAADAWSRTPWPHNVLTVVDEHGQGALTRVYKKAVATAEAGGRVVMVVQEAPREGEPKSCRAYQSLSGSGVAVDATNRLIQAFSRVRRGNQSRVASTPRSNAGRRESAPGCSRGPRPGSK